MMKRIKKGILLTCLVVLAAFPLIAGGNSEVAEEEKTPAPVETTPAPADPAQKAPAGIGGSWSVYPPKGWITDFNEAVRTAEEENKMILLNYTGSDWCVWCHRLRDEVFNTPAFEEWAEENLVMVFLDFPSSITLSEDQMNHNGFLQALFGVEGFPTLLLLGPDLEPLLRTGYQAGGAEEYIRHLSEDRVDLTPEQVVEFQTVIRTEVERILGPL